MPALSRRGQPINLCGMAKKGSKAKPVSDPPPQPPRTGKPAALLAIRPNVSTAYSDDNLEQLGELPDACVKRARVLKKTGSHSAASVGSSCDTR